VTTLTEHPRHPGTVISEVRRGRRPRPLGGQTGTRAEERVRPRGDPTKLGAAAGPSGPRAAAMRPRNAIRRGPSRPRRS